MNSGALVFVGIAPHPPVMVPEVGGASAEKVRDSIEAMREMTERINSCGAETVVIISPHAPLEERAFVAYDGPRLRGDFANFRAPHATVDVPLDAELLGAIEQAAEEEGFRVARLKARELDHGTAVPLYFLVRNGWDGRAVALGYSFLSDEDHVRFGVSVARAVERTGRSTAFIASGDLSHRLKPGAPAGFNPKRTASTKRSSARFESASPRASRRLTKAFDGSRASAATARCSSPSASRRASKGLRSPALRSALRRRLPRGADRACESSLKR
jgi:aromatic ring-opening dioxygenase LigB subunit